MTKKTTSTQEEAAPKKKTTAAKKTTAKKPAAAKTATKKTTVKKTEKKPAAKKTARATKPAKETKKTVKVTATPKIEEKKSATPALAPHKTVKPVEVSAADPVVAPKPQPTKPAVVSQPVSKPQPTPAAAPKPVVQPAAKPATMPQPHTDRHGHAKPVQPQEKPKDDKTIRIVGQPTVKELAEKMNFKINDFIKKLMTMGIFATINQRLEKDMIELIVDECGFKAELAEEELTEEALASMDTQDDPASEKPAPLRSISVRIVSKPRAAFLRS